MKWWQKILWFPYVMPTLVLMAIFAISRCH